MTGARNRVAIERRERVAIVRFANPPDGVISTGGAAELVAALRGLIADDGVAAIVMTGGTDGIFIRHADVGQISRALVEVRDGRLSPDAFGSGAFFELCGLLDRADKPVIAAIDGICMGGGFEIALACTMRIASPAATAIGLPEIRLDIFPGGGGTQRLARLIGRHRARLFILLGEILNAEQAHAAGLVDELAPSALARAIELAELLSKRSASAVAAILELTSTTEDSPRLGDECRRFAQLGQEDKGLADRLRHFSEGAVRLDQLD